ncbi:tyrosine-type recombinase/integrase [Cupriavidus metallidurans]|uniref:tyrosine-type recombinase/integrase n=1 Tax=Cupriavidus metallidurans TaxID=119219 RepID=UPI003D06E5B3
MPLTDVQIRGATAQPKQYRLADAGGLYLEVRPNGGRYWRVKYRFAGKEKALTLGTYPEVSLREARAKRDAAKKKLSDGIDPSEAKQAEKRTLRLNAENSFDAVAREWHAKFAPTLSESHAQRNLRRLEVHVFPYAGGQPIAQLEAPAVLDILQRIEKTGHLETAHRVRVLVGQVMRYAISTGRASRDVSADLRDALPPPQVKHHAAVTDPVQLGALLRAIDGYNGTAVVGTALRLAPLVFQRPGELRQAEWPEFDLDGAMWVVPATRMKRTKAGKDNGPDHLVPLSRQAVEILRALHLLTGRGRFVFPSLRGGDRCMSDMALSAAFKRMGFDSDTALPHGWRATARTLAVEALGVPAEVVEMQLAHGVRDSLGRAYNRTQWLDARRDLMQKWSDYLDRLKAGAEVIVMPTPAA